MIKSAFVLQNYRKLKLLGVIKGAFAVAELLWIEGIRGETGQNTVLFSFQRGQIVNGQTTNAGSLALRIRETDFRLTAGF